MSSELPAASALYYHPACLRHSNGPGHPERPERLEALSGMLAAHYADVPLREGRDATPEEILLIHDRGYVDRLEAQRHGPFTMLDPDTGLGPGSLEAAYRGAGMTIDAALRLRSGEIDRPFVFSRPPGHHAEASRAMGFCLFNGVAIAARRLQQEYPGDRVAIIDYDVHHGNGSQWSFYDAPSVLYLSLHQFPLFPGTGRLLETGGGSGQGRTVNLPMAGGKTDDDYFLAFDTLLLPILREFSPDTIIVSAGFDAHEADPLGGMALSSAAYLRFTRRLLTVAEDVCHGRLLHVLEGGYNLEALTESARLVLTVLTGTEAPRAGQPAPEDSPAPAASPAPADSPAQAPYRELEEAMVVQRQYWSSL